MEKPRSFLSSSPVKMLSSFLGGTSSTSTPSETVSAAPKLARAPVSGLFPSPMSRSGSFKETGSLSGSIRDKDGIRLGTDDERPENPLVRLEQTFTGYVACLQARKGYFIGRTLLTRSFVDELQVNELYNRLLESPFDIDSSADLGAETTFVAFEKFVKIAWREQIGPVMTTQALDALQVRASKRVPGDFADFVNYLFGDMAPQNRRAFTALIKLLADLLEGCGNDGDRGALTLAFAQLLVDDDVAHNYINLLDRLVEDCDRIFDDIGPGAPAQFRSSANESLSSASRAYKSGTGSMTSNTSSLRRKFGFDNLLRQNSKPDGERPSVWRSLSKHNRNPATGESSSLSKASVNRSRSVDMTGQMVLPLKQRRPGSRDRPPVAGVFDDIDHRPASSHRLETIGEPEAEEAQVKSAKKKRRSSLSDLKTLMAQASLDDPVPVPLMPLNLDKQTGEKFNSSPRGVSPSKIPISPHANSQSLRSPRQKENAASDPFSPKFVPPRFGAETAKSPQKGHSKTLSTSQIPTLKPPRRTSTADSPPRPSSSPSKGAGATQKLRLQSPQKLRERLQVEKKAVEEVDSSLKTELSRISEDMARVNSSIPRSATTDIRKLAASVQVLEERIPQMMQELQERQAAIQADMDSTLKATESKVRAIDQLYKEATAENELLYEKFNGELGKIVKALKGKGKDDKEEIANKLRESGEELARAKKENARLRREMASLRAAMRGGDS